MYKSICEISKVISLLHAKYAYKSRQDIELQPSMRSVE